MERKYLSSKKTEEEGGGLMLKLPIEIFARILSSQSIKTLSAYRFACKSWFHTITNPSFVAAYNTNLIHNRNEDINSSLIVKSSNHSFNLLHREFKAAPTTYSAKLPPVRPIVGIVPCNGLLLLVSFEKLYLCYVCNPITGDYISVPASALPGCSCLHSFGFGYDPVSGVSKIIKILEVWDPSVVVTETNVEIYNVAMGKWRVMEGDQLLVKPSGANGEQVTIGSFKLPAQRRYVFLNGALHWIAYSKISPTSRTIISFKLDTEEFYQVQLPPGFDILCTDDDSKQIPIYLFVVRECLSLVDCVGPEHTEIWVMKDSGLNSYWEKEYIIKNIVMDNGDLIRGPYKPIKVVQNGGILLVYEYDSKKLGYYHPVTEAFRSFGSTKSDYGWEPVFHVGNLVSPGSIAI